MNPLRCGLVIVVELRGASVKRVVAFPLSDGESVLVEVDMPDDAGGTVRASRAGEITETARVSFEDALSKIKPSAEYIISCLRGLTHAPDQVVVEFGIKLSAQAGAIIASAGVEANYTITMTWNETEGKTA